MRGEEGEEGRSEGWEVRDVEWGGRGVWREGYSGEEGV